MQKRAIYYSILTVLISTSLFLSASPVYALETPNFPSCPNPGGTIIASYTNGTHGVPGDTKTYTGEDVVYKLNDTQVVQCLCPDSGSGIQTNWLKSTGLTDADKNILENTGWIRIPNGALWGLDGVEYFTKNSSYNCGGQGGGGDVLGATVSKAGEVLGVSTLAATGDFFRIFALFASAVVLFFTAKKLV